MKMEIHKSWKSCWFYHISFLVVNFCGHFTICGSDLSCIQDSGQNIDCIKCSTSNGTMIMDCSIKGLRQVNITEDCPIIGLNLSHNSLVTTPEINGNQLIEWIDLSHNRIRILKRLNGSSVKYLDVSYNAILSLSIQGLYNYSASLEILNLSNNHLTVNSFNICHWHIFNHLWLLDLRNNPIDVETNPASCDQKDDCLVILVDAMSCNLSCNHTFTNQTCESDSNFYQYVASCLVCMPNVTEKNCPSDHTRDDKFWSSEMTTPSVTTLSVSTNMVAATSEGSDNSTIATLVDFFKKNWRVSIAFASSFFSISVIIFTWRICRRKKRSKRYDKWVSVYNRKAHTAYPSLEKVVVKSELSFTSKPPMIEKRPTLREKAKSHEVLSQHSIKRNRHMIRKQTTSLPVAELEETVPKRILSWI